MDSYVAWTRQKYQWDWRTWRCTRVKHHSRITIKIVLGLSLIWWYPKFKSEIGKIIYPQRTYYLASTRTNPDIPLGRNKSDRVYVFQLSKLLFKLNQLVQGIQQIFLEKGVVQRSGLLTNLTTQSCDNMAILPERHPEYHGPPHVT